MAEVRLCCGSGALRAAHRLCGRYLLTARNKQRRASAPPPPPSCAGPLLSDVTGNNGNGGGSAAKEPGGLPWDGYTRVNPRVDSGDAATQGGDAGEFGFYLGPNNCRFYNCGPGGSGTGRYYRSEYRGAVITSRAARRHGHLVLIRAYSGNGSRDQPLYRSRTGYYELLGVTPTATHAQIKTAYYRQSFLYHPDRNAGSEEATARFSDISEAYTVLGNKGLRRKYDRGLLSASDLTATIRPSGRTADAGRPQSEARRSVTGINNRSASEFDKFFRSHYSEQLQREKDIRVRKEEMLKRKAEATANRQLDRITELAILGLLVVALGLVISLKRG